MQKRKTTGVERNTIVKFATQIAASFAAGLAAAGLIFAVLAAICCKIDLAPQILLPVTTAAIALAMLPAGFLLATLRAEKGMLYGTLIALLFYIVLWIFALAQGQTEFSVLSAIKGIAMLCAGAIGGYAGIARRTRRRRMR